MKRIKETYLLLLIVIGLFSLSIYSTYALFTEEYTVGMLNVNTGSYIVDLAKVNQYKHIDIYAGESKKVTFNLLNSTGTKLFYGVYTDSTSKCITFNYDPNYSVIRGSIDNNVSKTIVIELTNSCPDNKAIKLYVMTSTESLENTNTYPDGKTIITNNKMDNITDILEEETEKEPTITLTPIANHLISLYEQGTSTFLNTPNEDKISIVSNAGLLKDSYGNIRYYGTNPNNYLKFNDELWRIIGIFDTETKNGNPQKLVKIIKVDSLGKYSFDNKPNTYGTSLSDNGSNNWTDSRLMMMLNPNYDIEQVDTNQNIIYKDFASLYWNSKSGICYTGLNNTNINCNFAKTGLNATSRNFIEEVKYYLGGIDNIENLYPLDYYKLERANPTWIGHIGLIYPSDFAYASDLNICTNTLENYNDSECNNWLSDNNSSIWTMIPSSSNSDIILSIDKNNAINSTMNTSTSNSIRPVAYLKSNITIIEGNGTITNPYVISLIE